jgi:hypothetical protein
MMINTSLLRAAIVTFALFLFASVSFAQTTKSYIEKMTGWTSCSVCAGKAGKGATITHSMKQNVTSPTMGKKSVEFSVNGTSPYGAALWWKQLGSEPNAHNFTYDLYYYLKNPAASQALEFDVNQSLNGHRYVFGTQCNIASHTYQVWSVATRWTNTGIACIRPTAYKWNHITLEFQRTTAGKVSFISMTLNGVKHYIKRSYAPQTSHAKELNVAFQMDGNKAMVDYQTWVENVSLKYW